MVEKLYFMTNTLHHAIFGILLIGAFACSEEPIPECHDCPEVFSASDANYLPLTEGTTWIYNSISAWENWVVESKDTIVVDTLSIEDIDYKLLRGGYYFLQPVRKDGDTYFHRTLSCGFGPEEFLFKEIKTPMEEIAISVSPEFLYTVMERRLDEYTVNGQTFSDVIEVIHKYAALEIKLYYANNIGLIERKETSSYHNAEMKIEKYDIKK